VDADLSSNRPVDAPLEGAPLTHRVDVDREGADTAVTLVLKNLLEVQR
jgi:hypothetical protein